MSRIEAFDYSVDLLQALLWQHDGAEALKTLARKKQDWYNTNQRDFWQDWQRDVFNLDTANAFGLAVWGRILNIPLAVPTEDTRAKAAFGFGTNHLNFNNGNFANAGGSSQVLSVDQQRLVLQLRYFQLVTRGAVTEVNEWLKALLGEVFVVDNLDMTCTYFFRTAPPQSLRFILEQYDLLPRPAGVGVSFQIQPKPSFGFGIEHLNFNNGNFGA